MVHVSLLQTGEENASVSIRMLAQHASSATLASTPHAEMAACAI